MPKSKHVPANDPGTSAGDVKEKKPFDKARWREKKYSKKFKVDQWEERRRKAALHSYYKDLRKEDPTAPRPELRKKRGKDLEKSSTKANAYQQALDEFERKKAEKEARQKVIENQKAERIEALNQYRIKKAERFKKLSKKTKRGQPVMKDRMEMLLEKIQKETNYQ